MRSLAVLGLLLWLASASPAMAQVEGDVARARELFQSGLDAAHEQQWVQARDAFAESLAIAERPSTLLNLAGAQVQTGRLVEGAASYRRFLELATGPREASHRADARSALAAVETRIPHVTFHVEGLAPGDMVRLDDNVLLPAALDTSNAIDPGAHDLTVRRNGETVGAQHFELGETVSIDVELTVARAIASPEQAASLGPAPMDEAIAMPVEEHGDDTGLWIGVGVGVGAAVVIGVIVGVVLATQGQSPTPYAGNFGDGIVRF